MSREIVENLYCTTEIGAERPIHKCGHPMSKMQQRGERQQWRCKRVSCNEVQREAYRRYRQSEKGREARRRYRQSEKGRETHREARRRYEQSGKGYLTRRRRDLGQQRTRILEQLEALKEVS